MSKKEKEKQNKNPKQNQPTTKLLLKFSHSFPLPFLVFEEQQYMATLHRLHLISLFWAAELYWKFEVQEKFHPLFHLWVLKRSLTVI